MGNLLKSLMISAAMVFLATPSYAQLWRMKISQPTLKINEPAKYAEPASAIHVFAQHSGSLLALDGNTICFPASTFLPNNFAFLGKSILSAADAKFYYADDVNKMSAILAGKCLYEFSHRYLSSGPNEFAQIVDQHSPNIYFIVSRVSDCSPVDKKQLDDPVFADAEFSCTINYHGIFVK